MNLQEESLPPALGRSSRANFAVKLGNPVICRISRQYGYNPPEVDLKACIAAQFREPQ